MGLLEKWILKRAADITAKNEKARQADHAAQVKRWETQQALNSRVRDILRSYIEPKIATMENQDCHIFEGDTAVLNVYELVHKCNNGWDGGPRSYLNHCGEDDKSKPVLCRIEKIYVDTSFFDDLVDKFLENTSVPLDADDMRVLNLFHDFLRRRPTLSNIFSKYGLYRTAKFSPLSSGFKPSWGLNVGSFLNVNTPEGKETINVWEREAALETARVDLNKALKEIEIEKREISAKYRNIIYC